jgi:hypothetical protein
MGSEDWGLSRSIPLATPYAANSRSFLIFGCRTGAGRLEQLELWNRLKVTLNVELLNLEPHHGFELSEAVEQLEQLERLERHS